MIQARRLPLLLGLSAALLLTLAVPAWAEPKTKQASPADKKADKKVALAASYDPVSVNGQSWYRGFEAALVRNKRLAAKARPIVLLRILGELDGDT